MRAGRSDIDGVICCNLAGHLEENKLAQLKRIVVRPTPTAHTRHSSHTPPTPAPSPPAGPAALSWFVPSQDATGAKVVLSTDWRRQAPLKKILLQVAPLAPHAQQPSLSRRAVPGAARALHRPRLDN